MQGFKPAFLHAAYETVDIDAIGQGDQYLRSKGYRHSWGLGRHIFGSQLFCYHRDPYGDEIEHYADGDVFDNSVPTQYRNLEVGNSYQWGEDLPREALPSLGFADVLVLLKGVIRKRLDLKLLKKMKQAADSKPRPWSN